MEVDRSLVPKPLALPTDKGLSLIGGNSLRRGHSAAAPSGRARIGLSRRNVVVRCWFLPLARGTFRAVVEASPMLPAQDCIRNLRRLHASVR